MIANLLTALRLVLTVPVAWGIARPGTLPVGAVLGCVLAAIASDFLDGFAARSRGTVLPRGRLYDHATDFVFVTSGLVAAGAVGMVPMALPVLIVIAFSQYVVDSYWLHREKQLRMSVLGRWNGILYFVPLIFIGIAQLIPGTAAWGELVRWLSWALIGSTILSILDRALAPRRAAEATFASTMADGIGTEINAEAGT